MVCRGKSTCLGVATRKWLKNLKVGQRVRFQWIIYPDFILHIRLPHKELMDTESSPGDPSVLYSTEGTLILVSFSLFQ